ncbi:hypothetical protein D3C87_1313660 [compost metagenome]
MRTVRQRGLAFLWRRVVQQAQAIGQRRQLQLGERALEHGLRQGLRHRRAGHRPANRLAQIGLRDAGRGWVDRRQAVWERLAGHHGAHLRVDHLGAEEAPSDLAAHAQTHAFGHLLGLAAIEIEKTERQLAGVVGDLDHQLAARPEGNLVRDDLALHLRGQAHAGAPNGLADGFQRGLVLVAHGQVQHEVHRTAQTQLGQAGHGGRRLGRRGRLALGGAPERRVVGAAGFAGFAIVATVEGVGGGAWHQRGNMGGKRGTGRCADVPSLTMSDSPIVPMPVTTP